MARIICGMFDRSVDADAALEELKREGFRRSEVDAFYVSPPGHFATGPASPSVALHGRVSRMGSRLPSRRTENAKLRTAREQSRSQSVKLRIVASMLHHERSGRGRDSMRGPEYLRELNEAAAALGKVADIYWLEAGGMLRIPKEELRGAEYLDGGNILRTATGALYHPLAMRRADAIGAITFLCGEKASA